MANGTENERLWKALDNIQSTLHTVDTRTLEHSTKLAAIKAAQQARNTICTEHAESIQRSSEGVDTLHRMVITGMIALGTVFVGGILTAVLTHLAKGSP